MRSKAYIPAPEWLTLVRSKAADRWGVKSEALEGWLDRHPYAEHMAIRFTLADGVELTFNNAQGRRKIKASGSWGIYDMVLTPADGRDVRLTLKDAPNHPELPLDLPAGCEITYPDLLRLIDEQHGEKFWPSEHWPGMMVRARKLSKDLQQTLPEVRSRVAAWMADFWLF